MLQQEQQQQLLRKRRRRRRRRRRRHSRPNQKQHPLSVETMARMMECRLVVSLPLLLLLLLSTWRCSTAAAVAQWSSPSTPSTTTTESTVRGTGTLVDVQSKEPYVERQQDEVPTLGMDRGGRTATRRKQSGRRTTSTTTLDPQRPRRRQAQASPRIINGNEADPSQFPFVVVLTSKHNLKCAGSVRSFSTLRKTMKRVLRHIILSLFVGCNLRLSLFLTNVL